MKNMTWPEVQWKWHFGENVHGFLNKKKKKIVLDFVNNKARKNPKINVMTCF